MKKIVLSLAVLASVALVSCGDKKAEAAADSDSVMIEDTIVAAEVATDSDTVVAVQETVTETPAPAADSAK
ncbi:MAG: DUF4348 domain-containing protein [Bacteroidales bacterium]|nr:DUF4348 domain-containing protein [Bacteroidales bacterium]MBD5212518.1 DUF4348 domain-containing protein [Bacteroidales bacterium]MBD5217982.1 DUF4348 domain-containing protein [Bacteroidales bacterium]MBD5222076.1 DUF4348 domain-containing protein [Bacteroidales bacterium]